MSKEIFKSHSLKSTFNVTEVITILSYELSESYRNEGEVHDFWEMVYLCRGRLDYRRGEERFSLREGELLFHPPGEFHSIECDGESSASVFIMTFRCKSPAMRLFYGRSFPLSAALKSQMQRLTAESLATFTVSEYPIATLPSAPLGGEQMVKMYLEELLIKLLRSEATGTSEGTDKVIEDSLSESICNYLKERLNERVTLDQVSEAFHFGKSRLCDIFKKSRGVSIIHYHITLKMEEAKRLLREGRTNVFEISERLGFESPEYFSRMFKSEVGMSPTRFRATPAAEKSRYLDKELRLGDESAQSEI